MLSSKAVADRGQALDINRKLSSNGHHDVESMFGRLSRLFCLALPCASFGKPQLQGQ